MVVPAGNLDTQDGSPFFNCLPAEIRAEIYELVFHSYDDRSKKYKPTAPYYRPGYKCAQKIDTTFLLTCQRIYQEARFLPARINELTAWYHRGPPEFEDNLMRNESLAASIRWRELRTVHIFAQQFWLEDYRRGFGLFTNLWQSACPTSLKITIRHSDWYWWEYQAPLALDPKQAGRTNTFSRPSDGFEWGSWGSQFRKIRGLKTLQLELETVEGKMGELDAIVARAKHWNFPLEDDHFLILDESKTKRTGWNGKNFNLVNHLWERENDYLRVEDEGQPDLGSSNSDRGFWAFSDLSAGPSTGQALLEGATTTAQPSDRIDEASGTNIPANTPRSARERLIASGVQFNDAESYRGSRKEILTYYVVTLTWQAHAK